MKVVRDLAALLSCGSAERAVCFGMFPHCCYRGRYFLPARFLEPCACVACGRSMVWSRSKVFCACFDSFHIACGLAFEAILFCACGCFITPSIEARINRRVRVAAELCSYSGFMLNICGDHRWGLFRFGVCVACGKQLL